MIGQSVGSDANPLSCFLFRPRKSREKCRKRSHTNASNASVILTSRVSQTPPQTPPPYFYQWVSHIKRVLAQSSTKRPTFAFAGESGYTLGFAQRIAHGGSHAETGGVSDGGAITTLGAFRTFTNIPGPGIRTAYFAAFGSWTGAFPKNTESLRNSDALMRVAVPKASRPRWAAQLYLFIGVFTFVKDLAGCCQYSSPITKGAADPNIRIGTLSGYDQNTPLPLKDPKAQCYASAHPCIAAHGASSVRVRLPPPERCAGRRP